MSSRATLPTSIYVSEGPLSPDGFHLYRGAPDEMARQMADEMGCPSIASMVDEVLGAIAQHRKIVIHLPDGLADDELAEVFVFALLETKIARPVAQA